MQYSSLQSLLPPIRVCSPRQMHHSSSDDNGRKIGLCTSHCYRYVQRCAEPLDCSNCQLWTWCIKNMLDFCNPSMWSSNWPHIVSQRFTSPCVQWPFNCLYIRWGSGAFAASVTSMGWRNAGGVFFHHQLQSPPSPIVPTWKVLAATSNSLLL